ncbi:MAG: hypothetical protein M0D57_10975 [Sphingobacteriales bacterium JAD_PAG50586_3]|nr:MAG: hypothetical protein M0D57_10975 [Sphingobacteriales bacterium JAD_PAG50586_3]
METDAKPTEQETQLGLMLLESFRFWEGRRRLIYNVCVGFVGLFAFVVNPYFFIFILFGGFFYGVFANAFYTLGYGLDSIIIHNSKGKWSLAEYRELLYWGGLLFSVFLTGMSVLSMAFFRP